MSQKRAFGTQDNSIFERSLTSNVGLAPILQLENLFDTAKERKQFSRILMKFNLSAITGDISAGNLPNPATDSTVTTYLYVYNCKHGDEQATSFSVNVHPLTQEWTEGNGLDLDNLTETGYANAVSADSTNAWTTTGGTFEVDANSATQSFDHGEEDLKVDITNLFNEWYAGNTGNFGVILKMTDAQEIKTGSTSANSLYYKKFYGRTTNTRKRPYIALEWDDSIKDDRNSITFNSTGLLWFYNIINGQLQDLNSTDDFPGNITLSGLTSSTQASGTSITTNLTAARHSKGIYKCNIGTLALTANTYTAFKDNWFVSASPTANYTFDFTTTDANSGFDEFKTASYKVVLRNLKNQYEENSKTRIFINIKDDSITWTPMTAATTATNTFTCTDATVEIREVDTDEVELPAENLSYDKNGNFFVIDTTNLYTGYKYYPVIKLNIRGETIYLRDQKKYSFEII